MNIIYHTDTAILIVKNEDDLHKLLHHFNLAAKRFTMEISIRKTKTIVIVKEPTRCKAGLEEKMTQQIMNFNY